MSVISMKQLLEAGVHFGHQTRRWNPKMAPYIYTERNGIYIIDLQKSVGKVDEAYNCLLYTSALLDVKGEKKPLEVKYQGDIASKEELDVILKDLEGAKFVIKDIKKGERTKKAPLPFTTSTLQQEASKQLNFSTQKTMRLAQQLYEGVDVKGQGSIGVITYLRTDSVRISEEADKAAREYIHKQYGEKYVASGEESKKSGGKIQDAHEAIRPTDISLTPVVLKEMCIRDSLFFSSVS